MELKDEQHYVHRQSLNEYPNPFNGIERLLEDIMKDIGVSYRIHSMELKEIQVSRFETVAQKRIHSMELKADQQAGRATITTAHPESIQWN